MRNIGTLSHWTRTIPGIIDFVTLSKCLKLCSSSLLKLKLQLINGFKNFQGASNSKPLLSNRITNKISAGILKARRKGKLMICHKKINTNSELNLASDNSLYIFLL